MRSGVSDDDRCSKRLMRGKARPNYSDILSRSTRRHNGTVLQNPDNSRVGIKHVFVQTDRAVEDRLGHGIGLGPDHVGAQMPAARLQRESHAPRMPIKSLRLSV